MVDILIERKTARIEYTMDFIFGMRGITFQLLTDPDAFERSTNYKLCYSGHSVQAKTIVPSKLLNEERIRELLIDRGDFSGVQCVSFDGVSDPIASIFYTLTRYEEYTCTERDDHGRFPYEKSVLRSWDWIERAMCDRWSMAVLNFIGIEPKKDSTSVRLIPTFDIDNVYAYKFKTGKRKYLSIAKDLIGFNGKRLKERNRVSRGQKDPYDTFSLIESVANRYPETLIFWLVGDLAPKDRNLGIDVPKHRLLIQKMDSNGRVNLHPSYASGGEIRNLVDEKKRLEKVLGRTVNRSRQHFLRFSVDRTFANLNATGFEHEYSMGFAEKPGFRSGTAHPYYWFDLSTNRKTNLCIHPFVYMDGSLNEYLHLSVEESKRLIDRLYAEVAEYGGDFVFIWHNETIGDYGKWKGWKAVLDHTLNLNK